MKKTADRASSSSVSPQIINLTSSIHILQLSIAARVEDANAQPSRRLKIKTFIC